MHYVDVVSGFFNLTLKFSQSVMYRRRRPTARLLKVSSKLSGQRSSHYVDEDQSINQSNIYLST